MGNWNWEQLGDNIYRSVQNAVDSHDFSSLNQTIRNTIDDVSQEIRDAGNAFGYGRRRQDPPFGQPYSDRYSQQRRKQRAYQEQWYQQKQQDAGYHSTNTRTGNPNYAVTPVNSELYARTGGTQAASILLGGLGAVLGGVSLIGLIVSLVGGAMFWGGVGNKVVSVIFLVLFGLGTGLGIFGFRKSGKVRRFRRYLQILGRREYCDLKELADKTGQSIAYIKKDLIGMIGRGWFRQGCLDEKKTCLITSKEAYDQYRQMMNQQKEREAEERREEEKYSPELREIIRRGDEYVAKIRACNDAIPGEEISAKISRMELLVDRIFDRVEQHPESVSDIQRLMDYYLPTTMKLLEAYEELDTQPVQGENILSSKREIEKTLDTLNQAFERLLDDMFQDTAWDVSSDISVLNSMLAQEGLKEKDFEQKQ